MITATRTVVAVPGAAGSTPMALYHRTTNLQGQNASAYVNDGGSVQFGAGGAGMIAS